MAIWALITGGFDETGARVLASAIAVALCTLAGLAGAMVAEQRGGQRVIGQTTIGLAAVEAGLALVGIWSVGEYDAGDLWRVLGVGGALLVALTHTCLMLARQRASDTWAVKNLVVAAIALAFAAAIMTAGLFAFATGTVDPTVWRLLGVLVVLAVLATLLCPLLRRISRGRDREGESP
ncbi:MAG: hypothetical protein E6G56_07515 [Actinobacteria bacterium]|nr:MAG: hypothetical protein E6G56_07515 [Actinomycetota bacterium]